MSIACPMRFAPTPAPCATAVETIVSQHNPAIPILLVLCRMGAKMFIDQVIGRIERLNDSRLLLLHSSHIAFQNIDTAANDSGLLGEYHKILVISILQSIEPFHANIKLSVCAL